MLQQSSSSSPNLVKLNCLEILLIIVLKVYFSHECMDSSFLLKRQLSAFLNLEQFFSEFYQMSILYKIHAVLEYL